MNPAERPLFSHPVAVSSIRVAGQELVLTASGAEREALSRHLGLVSLDRFEARLALKREGARVRATGRFEADVVQSCVVTLEPLPAHLGDTIDLTFAEEVAPPEPTRVERLQDLAEIEIELSEEDPPEPIVNGRFDPGPVLVEMLSLALDPYPRKPGVAFEMPGGSAEPSPFAALARLKPKTGG